MDKKYDCSKVIDYVHEMKRMCDLYSYHCDGKCPLANYPDCRYTDELTEKHIEAVQKWSDGHPEKPEKVEVTKRDDEGLMTAIVTKICNYAIANNLSPDESLKIVSENILALLEIASFDNWEGENPNDSPNS